jgi:hypothetical protein
MKLLGVMRSGHFFTVLSHCRTAQVEKKRFWPQRIYKEMAETLKHQQMKTP